MLFVSFPFPSPEHDVAIVLCHPNLASDSLVHIVNVPCVSSRFGLELYTGSGAIRSPGDRSGTWSCVPSGSFLAPLWCATSSKATSPHQSSATMDPAQASSSSSCGHASAAGDEAEAASGSNSKAMVDCQRSGGAAASSSSSSVMELRRSSRIRDKGIARKDSAPLDLRTTGRKKRAAREEQEGQEGPHTFAPQDPSSSASSAQEAKRSRSSPSAVGLADLTPDDYEHLARFLDTSSALALLRTCRAVHRRLSGSPGFWRELCLKEKFHEYTILRKEDEENEQEGNNADDNADQEDARQDEEDHEVQIRSAPRTRSAARRMLGAAKASGKAERLTWSGEKFHDVDIPEEATYWHRIFLRGVQVNVKSTYFLPLPIL